ncbi:hypothetical protein WOLCODRAFT_151258 [Wolfiporia cocos MD-104 SS10]|uniref:Uncharacterized protein n=1 Tax=Wolfiporia cocos (strain MD-104) TaxID=742152 RepID=A0A2H3JGC0_WOLCO|nr:hypothetical protein WOLCODRAFT_151258 [Wolfiporia cocos MD-104 SS10]
MRQHTNQRPRYAATPPSDNPRRTMGITSMQCSRFLLPCPIGSKPTGMPLPVLCILIGGQRRQEPTRQRRHIRQRPDATYNRVHSRLRIRTRARAVVGARAISLPAPSMHGRAHLGVPRDGPTV